MERVHIWPMRRRLTNLHGHDDDDDDHHHHHHRINLHNKYYITLFRPMTMFSGTNNISHNIPNNQ